MSIHTMELKEILEITGKTYLKASLNELAKNGKYPLHLAIEEGKEIPKEFLTRNILSLQSELNQSGFELLAKHSRLSNVLKKMDPKERDISILVETAKWVSNQKSPSIIEFCLEVWPDSHESIPWELFPDKDVANNLDTLIEIRDKLRFEGKKKKLREHGPNTTKEIEKLINKINQAKMYRKLKK